MSEEELQQIEAAAEQVIGGSNRMAENVGIIADGILSNDARIAAGELDQVQTGRVIECCDAVHQALRELHEAVGLALQRLGVRGD